MENIKKRDRIKLLFSKLKKKINNLLEKVLTSPFNPDEYPSQRVGTVGHPALFILDEEVFKVIQDNGRCEDNNDTIYNTIEKLEDMDDFVQSAISADGRGHFMGSYDGCENEETVSDSITGEGDITFYIYRVN